MRRPITNSSSDGQGRSGRQTRPGRRPRPRPGATAEGYSLIELAFVTGLTVTVGGMAIPQIVAGLDDSRSAGAARYVSTRMQRARMEAITRSSEVALQFVRTASGYRYAAFVDG